MAQKTGTGRAGRILRSENSVIYVKLRQNGTKTPSFTSRLDFSEQKERPGLGFIGLEDGAALKFVSPQRHAALDLPLRAFFVFSGDD